MMVLLGVLAAVVVLDLVLYAILLTKLNATKEKPVSSMPLVTVLLPARNEEKVIARCIRSIVQQEYPTNKIQILVGNDGSTDGTAALVEEFIKKGTDLQLLSIAPPTNHLKGKAHVLNELCKKAKGSVLLFTDADMCLPSTWIQTMVGGANNKNVGVVNGVTMVDNSWIQNLEWLRALGMIKVVNDLGGSSSSMGNNMLVRKEAYDKVGGYEGLPFSITEDFELYQHIKKAGYQSVQLMQPEVLGHTLPMEGVLALLNQRKRWMQGAVALPVYMRGLLALQMLAVPSALVLLVLWPYAGVVVLTHLIMRMGFLKSIKNKLGLKLNFFQVLIFELFAWTIPLFTLIYYILPFKVEWKERAY